MKYIVKLNSNGEDRNFSVVADTPKKATLTAIHKILNNSINTVEAWVENKQGNAWYYKIKINHNTRKLEVLDKKILR